MILKCFHAEADLSVLAVEINNFSLDLLADGKYIRWFCNVLSGDLRYMKKCIYSRCKLNKCTEICHTCNFTFYYVSYCEVLSSCKPWVLLREFKGKCDLISVDIFDKNCNFIAYVEDFLRVLYSAPGHLRDVKKSVCSAEVDECTEICNILNNTLNFVTNVDLSKKLFLFLSFLSKKKLFTVTDDTASSWVELCDNELNLLICIFGKVFLICVGNKACRNEYSCFLNINTKTTVKYLCLQELSEPPGSRMPPQAFVAFLLQQDVCRSV